jgi:methylglutaconyl-CoA hydratase
MQYSNIEVRTSAYQATVVINRPQARNALNAQTVQELTAAFTTLSATQSLRCILLTGSGTESFCAGADLNELANQPDPTARRAFFNSIATLVATMLECQIPIVTAVHGFALAGGMGLVAASDIALAADDAVFGLPEVAIGLAPMVVMAPLSATVSARALSQLALTGERIDAHQALAAGLVTRVVAKSTLDTEVQAVCSSLVSRGPAAVRATKQALRDIHSHDRKSFIFELADRSALVSIGAEAAEGIAAFREKRGPSWKPN